MTTPGLQGSDGDDRGGAAGRGGDGAVLLGTLLALMTALTVEVLAVFVGAAVAAVSGWERGPGMAAALAVASCLAWGLAGAVAYEAARRRAATIAAALLPAAIVAALLVVTVVIDRRPLGAEALTAVASAVLLGAAAWVGGRLRERRIRRRAALQ